MPAARQTPAPPGFVARWVVQGRTPDSSPCTFVFDLAEDHRHLMVHPAAIGTFSMLIDTAGAGMLLLTMDNRAACAVPGLHPVHGTRLLGLRPHDLPGEPSWTDRPADAPTYLGPMELYVHLPDNEIHIVYEREHLLELRDTLAEIFSSMR